MCEKLNEAANPMPEGSGKKGAVAIKALIGIVALGDIVMSAISFGLRKADEKKHEPGIAIADGLDLILTVVDFGLSYGVGYGIYSPMDSSNKRISGSKYEEIIVDTSDAAGRYSIIWIIKTVSSLFGPLTSFAEKALCNSKKKVEPVLEIAEENMPETVHEAEKKGCGCMGILERVFYAIHGSLCLTSAVLEIIACV